MKKIVFIFTIFSSFHSFSQGKDTVFTIRGYECKCYFHEGTEDDGKIFDKSEKLVSFPGGDSAWNRFLNENVRDTLFDKKEKFFIQLTINKDGRLSTFRKLSEIGDGKLEEVERLLLLAGRWFPAIQNGRCVNAYHRIMFEF